MVLNVDFLIDFFKKYTKENEKEEIGEQGLTSPSGGKTSVPKWADTYTLTRGKANRLGATGEKWNSGLTRGAANQIW
jgi:hypothetical protein